MRVAIDSLFEDPFRPTNALSYVRGLASNLPRLDGTHDYRVLVSRANRSHFQMQAPDLGLVWAGKSNENVALRIASQQLLVPLICRRMGVDVYYSPGNTLPLALHCASVLKINTMHHYRFAASVGWARTAYRRVMFAMSARRATLVLANSRSNYDDITHYFQIDPERVVTAPEPLDQAFLAPPTTDDQKREVRARYGLPPRYILFASSFWRYKNADGAIRAFARLSTRAGPTELVLAGHGPASYLTELSALASSLGVGTRVHFVGYIPHADLKHVYAAAEVFMYPSLYETFGHPPLQAMARGTPVVASDRSSIPEVTGDAALLADPADDDAVAEALDRAMHDGALRADLIERGRRRVALYSWDRVGAELISIFARAYALHKGIA